MIKFFIDSKEVTAQKGESILDVARREDIYIPTMCYLPKATANASCRMCSIEVEGSEGFILSCNTPPVEGIKVVTNSDSLYHERQSIMKLYNVNHPLQCGVCDKSGECDLQNKTLEFGLDEQSFSVRDQARRKKKWGIHTYDPGLCILCEKCTTVCNETVGNEALFIKPGGYKSHIEINLANCIQCGECISVCPVGAMASTDFKYTSNAWELDKIPSSCAHCSSACSLNYESKNGKIYRVTNESDFSSLCGSGRFGFDFDNKVLNKDKDAFDQAVDAFSRAKNVVFNSFITNEEAYLLSEMKKKFGFNLVNEDARLYGEFMQNFATSANESLYNATIDEIKTSEFILSVGCAIESDNPMIKFAASQAVKYKKAYVATIQPVHEHAISNVISQYINNEVGSEEAALAMIADTFVQEKESQQDFFDALDIGYLSGESNISEEELDLLSAKYKRKANPILIIGEDVINHPRAKNIALISGYLQKTGLFKVLVVPPSTNTLGVSLICELDKAEDGFSVGYNVASDFTLSAKGSGDIDIPALNQQEGTFVNIDKDLVVLNAGVSYHGYELNDIANALGIEAQNIIDYTPKLGFKEIAFDDLDNYYDNVGKAYRGYKITSITNRKKTKLDEVDELAEFNGSVVYNRNPLRQFSIFTQDCEQITERLELIGSEQFAVASKIKSGENVKFSIGGTLYERYFKVDKRMKGTVAYNPTFNEDKTTSNYRYTQVKLEVINE